jgi:hypothetical protein
MFDILSVVLALFGATIITKILFWIFGSDGKDLEERVRESVDKAFEDHREPRQHKVVINGETMFFDDRGRRIK